MSDRRAIGGSLVASLGDPDGPLGLEDAITLIERGLANAGLEVDLGEGRIARADGPRGVAGLLQRLKGHRTLSALAEGGSDLAALGLGAPPPVSPAIKSMLDAVRRAG